MFQQGGISNFVSSPYPLCKSTLMSKGHINHPGIRLQRSIGGVIAGPIRIHHCRSHPGLCVPQQLCLTEWKTDQVHFHPPMATP